MDGAGSKTSAEPTTATTRRGSKKTLTSAKLAELKSKAGLVAGALADFQAAGGIVAVNTVDYPGGTAIRLFLIVEGASMTINKTDDGLELGIE